MTARYLLLAVGCLLHAAGCAAPQRVVSINLCTDELALLLSRPGQLIAVTRLVKDPQLSSYWRKAATLPAHNNSIEQIVRFEPDLVLASRLTPKPLSARLRRLGIRVYTLPPVTDIDRLRRNLRTLGGLLGTPGKARQLIRRLDRRIAGLTRHAATGPRLRVLTYYPGGWTRNGGTLLNHLLRRAGMQHALPASRQGWSSVSLEQLLRLDPALLILVRPDSRTPSLATQLFRHPALKRYRRQRRLLSIPTRWISCGSPALTEVLSRLYAARHGIGTR